MVLSAVQSSQQTRLNMAGIESTLVDATALTHNEVNSQIGAAGDTVMTEPLMKFLTGCFE